DQVLWEIYTLEADIDHSGFDDPPMPAQPAPQAVWEHRLTDPWPESIANPDGSLDEVRLEGTFNAVVPAASLDGLVAEAFPGLSPAGGVAGLALAGDRPFPGRPNLPGLASLVQAVPVQTEPLDALRRAGFEGLHYEKLGDIHCFRVNGVELRELRLKARKPTA